MNLDSIKTKLCEFGDLRMCKAGHVFTLLITGSNLQNMQAVIGIQDALLPVIKEYPCIECLTNDIDHFMVVLKK